MILRMIGLNTSALQAKSTITTAEQKFHSGKNQKNGWKGICVCLLSIYKEHTTPVVMQRVVEFMQQITAIIDWVQVQSFCTVHGLLHLFSPLMIPEAGEGKCTFSLLSQQAKTGLQQVLVSGSNRQFANPICSSDLFDLIHLYVT